MKRGTCIQETAMLMKWQQILSNLECLIRWRIVDKCLDIGRCFEVWKQVVEYRGPFELCAWRNL